MLTTTPDSAVGRGFAGGYGANPGIYDEMVEPDGSLRPHWRVLVSQLDDLGSDELNRRWEQARRLIHENGVTHNVYGDPEGLDRPWSLDFAPMLVPADQWQDLEAGLIQRALLLDRIAADIYGPGNLLAEGLLPPELIYGHPGFLRACHGVDVPGGRRLHLYAADVIRGGDGRFAVLSDRTQAPSGAGYTLENRIVLSRVLPNLFRQCNVQRLAPFFMSLRQTMASLAPAHREDPRIVLLTPGPYNETYFEHAYLARYLGYTLAEGGDLTVRNNHVYLKTLGGLQPVDVILRRVDDDFCDPLELWPESCLGVPGLMEAVRDRHVAIANSLGSGILQAPMLLPFLPKLCRHLLGEDLKLPSVRTWWCGDGESLAYVRENLARLVIKPAFPPRSSNPLFGQLMSSAELDELSARIAADPVGYVAQESATPSTAPALVGDHCQPRRLVLRSFLVSSADSYTVMPGGLTRITGTEDSLMVSLQHGGGSKDTWVLANGPVSEVSLLQPAAQPVELNRGGGDLPSRVADNLFWLGRYVERSESIVRLARGVLVRLGDQSGLGGPPMAALQRALTGNELPDVPDQSEQDVLAALFSADHPAGLRATLNSVHAVARITRDSLSTDTWRILQSLEQKLARFNIDSAREQPGNALELLNELIMSLAAFVGLATDSMTRGQSWRFLDMGRRIERALSICQLLRATLVDVTPHEGTLLEAVLEVADSSMTYRRRYLTRLQVPAVADLLMADDTNPRSIAHQLAIIHDHLPNLPHDTSHPSRNPAEQLTLQLLTTLRLVDLQSECKSINNRRDRLDDLLKNGEELISDISDSINVTWFSHAAVSRQLASSGPEAGT